MRVELEELRVLRFDVGEGVEPREDGPVSVNRNRLALLQGRGVGVRCRYGTRGRSAFAGFGAGSDRDYDGDDTGERHAGERRAQDRTQFHGRYAPHPAMSLNTVRLYRPAGGVCADFIAGESSLSWTGANPSGSFEPKRK